MTPLQVPDGKRSMKRKDGREMALAIRDLVDTPTAPQPTPQPRPRILRATIPGSTRVTDCLSVRVGERMHTITLAHDPPDSLGTLELSIMPQPRTLAEQDAIVTAAIAAVWQCVVRPYGPLNQQRAWAVWSLLSAWLDVQQLARGLWLPAA
jgi:hypothetical protein